MDASGSERPGGVGLCIDSDPTRLTLGYRLRVSHFPQGEGYMDFGRDSYTTTVAGVSATAHTKDTVHVIKAGINYKFF